MSAPDKLNLLYVSTNVLNKDKSSSGNSADFFFTFKQSDFILKTTWFSKKTSEKRRPQQVSFPPQRS